MANTEALSRIKINKKLSEAGWRFFTSPKGPANIELELNTKIENITIEKLETIDENYTNKRNGFADYILKDEYNKPLLILEAKRKRINPLSAKEQAREYAESLGARYIILSNGDLDYFWDLQSGDPELITKYPTYESLKSYKQLNTDVSALVDMNIDKYYIAESQEPELIQSMLKISESKDKLLRYCLENNIRILREYQLKAIKSIQKAVKEGKERFLLEMATGTGKTLTAAGIIKMFIRSGLIHRVLFLVDRIELENQAEKNLNEYLKKDGIITKIYKEFKSDWSNADIVVTTVQSLTIDSRYKKEFVPTDFDLVISDEAHRSLGSSSRAVFEYFIGYKLGLTATPKNLMNGVVFEETEEDELERRMIEDTYRIFGCDSGDPTFRYQLEDGIRDEILVGPTVIDAETGVTNKLLRDNGLLITSDEYDEVRVCLKGRHDIKNRIFNANDFEKKIFSEATNIEFCKLFMEKALRDPITNEIGKSIVFCVNINHACKITQILNKMATKMFPGMYNSDFAMQITSDVHQAQQMTINFADNNLRGTTKWLEDYQSSKSRVVVTVGMMTTGYDCQDILNIGLFRPIHSPSEFIQIKGRGTRIYTFKDPDNNQSIKKDTFKLFDYFKICDYFEKGFNYDEKIKLSNIAKRYESENINEREKTVLTGPDMIVSLKEENRPISKVDIMLNKKFEDNIYKDKQANEYIEKKDIEGFIWYLKNQIFDKPNEYYNVKKIEKANDLDRKLTVREVALKLMGIIDHYKNKTEMLSDEFDNFKLINREECLKYSEQLSEIEAVFQAYILDQNVRDAIYNKDFASLMTTPIGKDIRKLSNVIFKGRSIFEYIKDYISESDMNCENFK